MILMALVLGFQMVNANPVDVNRARMVGQQFVQANFELNRQNVDMELVYTGVSTRGEACFYVFNYGNEGFVAVSADDVFRPIVAYSYEDPFDAQNINPEFAFVLNRLIASRTNRVSGQPSPEVAAEWKSVLETGKLPSRNGGRPRTFLCTTRWNQNPDPYNTMCPADPLGPGGHDYTGCVATAMAQLMKYWNHPVQGTGSHSYVCNPKPGYSGHPEYGTLTANFGATTYDWANMLDAYPEGSSYTPEQGEAVATIGYHCGVSVDMMYGNVQDGGSGAYSGDVPGAISQYFGYSSAAVYRSRDNYNRDNWMSMLKESIDMGWPLYYSGTDPDPVYGGGHAFICDGYDDADLFHFNWGWGNGGPFVDFDEIDYNTSDGAIFNFVPANVYSSTAQAPTNFNVVKTSDVAQSATVSWTNPSKTLTNTNISAIDRIVVERDGRVIYTTDNPNPGAAMSFVDDDVPCYSTFRYRIYAVLDGNNGKMATTTESFGPTCQWKVVGTSNNMAGWKGGKLVAYDGAGHEITSVTMTSSNPATLPINITVGKVYFKWMPGSDNVVLSIKIKDANGNTVYEFAEANSNTIPTGVLYEGNNSCTSAAPNAIDGELFATTEDGVVHLDWAASNQATYGYNIYRDGILFQLANTNSFVDEYATLGGHCYQVCVLNEGGESPLSNEVCASAGEGCDPALNLWFVIQTNHKPIINWTAPEHTEGLSNFIVYKKEGDDGEYEAIKTLAPNKFQYKDTNSLTDGVWYYYRVIAYYEDIDCYAAPAKARYGNEYFVKVLYTTTGVAEATADVNLYPNPTKDSFTIEGENLQQVMVYNALGQLVMNQECQGHNTVVNLGQVESGIYMVKVVTANGESIQKVSVIR